MVYATHLRPSCLSFFMNVFANGTRISGEPFFSSAWAASFATVFSAIVVIRWKGFSARAFEHYNVASTNRTKSAIAGTLPAKGNKPVYLVRRCVPSAVASAPPTKNLIRILAKIPVYAHGARKLAWMLPLFSVCLAQTPRAQTTSHLPPTNPDQTNQAEQQHRKQAAAFP